MGPEGLDISGHWGGSSTSAPKILNVEMVEK